MSDKHPVLADSFSLSFWHEMFASKGR